MKVTRSEPVLVHAAGDAAATVPAEEYYFLSNLDQNVAVLMKTVHVFNNPSPSTEARRDSAAAATLMRESLSTVLPSYYPFEGALAVRPDGRLAVRNARRGVPFVEAAADYELQEVVTGDVSAPGAAEVLADLVYVDDGVGGSENALETAAPLLTVQVTTFRCGGFVLGLAMNHCLADGQSAAEFLCSWAEAARGAPRLSTPPHLDRALQRARPVPTVAFPHDEFTEIEDVSGLAATFGDAPCVYRSFTFDAGKLERLKRAASGEDAAASTTTTATTSCSTFVALTAFVWVARTRAMRMRPEQKSKLLFAVDSRRRVHPPLPHGFWGNATVFACCISSAGDLLGRPLSAASRSIKDAIGRTDDAFIRSAVDYIELNRGALPSLTATTLVTAWNRLGFRAADFGWGPAVHSGPAELPQKEVVMILPGARDSQSKVLVVGLPLPCVQAFQEMVDQL
ncbi:Omega-hydroxypalmitate O-feruloyl transferase [Dichanthelium oligosanthes]|uniref:Omega-hydroxypalmitate O-feruloyl transferase n=1 Tax=Dichanthelium oligosanthes TaxID=888268 RepID=A0A1E5VP96_9POAL|nr:Omega-hydroxypalmitate O-feruloyl transferase [Dichanthelium oligosanthes]